ncbi:hypothetical protein [Nocardioides taihuensis]|uniref:WD40 repeat domain-containing protein n=1 Tax=Nocardioides taihuensis TaxID=1835606 RepID=A0ABW0BFV0_9ACTN
MNSADELERLLGQQLHQQVDGMTDAPIGLGDVKGRAGRIRRNRRIAGGVAVAAVLAVAVPTALLVAPGTTSADRVSPANPDNGPTQTVLTLDGLATGGSPLIEYFDDQGVVIPTQGQVPLDEPYQALIEVPADGTWLALSISTDDLVYLDGDFQRQTSTRITQRLVSNPDRSAVAFVAPEAGAQTLLVRSTTDVEGGQAWDFPELPVVQPVDFAGKDTVVYQSTDDRGRQEMGLALPDGTTEDFGGGFVKAISANPGTGLVAVQTKANDDGSGCFGVVDTAASLSATVWDTCDYSLSAFSPDGTYVLASDAYLSGEGPTSLSILDARDGSLVASFTQERGGQLVLAQVAWETDDTVLALARDGVDNAIIRMGVDGSIEQAVATAPTQVDTPYYLGADRLR